MRSHTECKTADWHANELQCKPSTRLNQWGSGPRYKGRLKSMGFDMENSLKLISLPCSRQQLPSHPVQRWKTTIKSKTWVCPWQIFTPCQGLSSTAAPMRQHLWHHHHFLKDFFLIYSAWAEPKTGLNFFGGHTEPTACGPWGNIHRFLQKFVLL